jgi:hypothetical protein
MQSGRDPDAAELTVEHTGEKRGSVAALLSPPTAP